MMQVRDSTVDVMRLSIIVRNNLEKDADGTEYHAASSTGAPSGDVKLNHTDAELDFEEQTADASEQLLCWCCCDGLLYSNAAVPCTYLTPKYVQNYNCNTIVCQSNVRYEERYTCCFIYALTGASHGTLYGWLLLTTKGKQQLGSMMCWPNLSQMQSVVI